MNHPHIWILSQMNIKPSTAAEYDPHQLDLVQSLCLYISTILGDYIDDLVIVGGLVPNLIIPQAPPPEGADQHVGTQDLDIGFSFGVLSSERYREIAARLRGAGFVPDVNEKQHPTFQRWKHKDSGNATVDFLIPKSSPDEIAHRTTNFSSFTDSMAL